MMGKRDKTQKSGKCCVKWEITSSIIINKISNLGKKEYKNRFDVMESKQMGFDDKYQC